MTPPKGGNCGPVDLVIFMNHVPISFLSDQLKKNFKVIQYLLMLTERVLSNDPMLHLQTDLEHCDINTSRRRT